MHSTLSGNQPLFFDVTYLKTMGFPYTYNILLNAL